MGIEGEKHHRSVRLISLGLPGTAYVIVFCFVVFVIYV